MLDLLLKNVYIFDTESVMDLGVQGERIVLKQADLTVDAKEKIDFTGHTVLPGFIDAHTHLDKALIANRITNESGTLLEAHEKTKQLFNEVNEKDIYERAYRVAKMAIANGTTALRTHININLKDGLKAVKPILALKETFKDELEIQIVAFLSRLKSEPPIHRLAEEALKLGVDVLGGTTIRNDLDQFIEDMFRIAQEFNVPLDFHVDETDLPNIDGLDYLAQKTIKENRQGRVTAGHCCSLSAVNQETADMVIKKVKEAELNIITLPSCNMFLMGRNDLQPIRRGVTRVDELLAAGVNVAYASDNIRDPFRPFGNADMLEEGLFTAQVLQKGYPNQLKEVILMGTYNPAKILMLKDYGLSVGDFASFVVLKASNAVESLLSQAEKKLVVYKGKVVARS